VTRTVLVTSTGASPFRAWLDESEGLAPFAPTLTVSNPGNVAFQRVEIDMQDDGTSDVTLPNLPGGMARVTLNYPDAGIYTVKVTVYAANGSTLFQARLRLKATAPAELAATIVGVYRTLTDRIAGDDAAGAVNLFVGDARSRYAEILAALTGTLPSVAAQLGTPIDGVVTGDWAELTLLRQTADGERAFPVYLIRGGDGIWRVESM
jgi:limonene-1,2-epoxide hydrolase